MEFAEGRDANLLEFFHLQRRPFQWVVILTQFFDLVRDLWQEQRGRLYVTADFTFGITIQKYAYGVLNLRVHRRLQDTSRVSFWPLVMSCAPSEDGSIYVKMFEALKKAFHDRDLPIPVQVGLDWFDGSRAAARQVYPGIQVRRGVEHMRRNLKNNQTRGRRGPRPRRAKAKAQPKRRQRRPRAAAPERAPAPPHLQHRPIWAALALVANLLFVPTCSMLHLCLTAVLDRIRRVWQESGYIFFVKFRAYFLDIYTVYNILILTQYYGSGFRVLYYITILH